MSIKYQAGYKYQLYDDYTHFLPESFNNVAYFTDQFISIRLIKDKKALTIRRGYAWDGPSGPSMDTKNFMRGALIHDALYQAMREGKILRTFKDAADRELQRVCIEDGMSSFRAWYVYQAVSAFGKESTIKDKDILVAP